MATGFCNCDATTEEMAAFQIADRFTVFDCDQVFYLEE